MSEENLTPPSETLAADEPSASDKGGYNANMIKSLDDVEHVRTRPGMYIGGYNPRGLHHLVYEIVDNSVDEALAGYAKHVHLLVRGPGLDQTMSRYLISRIEATEKITLKTWTRIEALEGDSRLERIRIRNSKTGAHETLELQHVFLMTGAEPNTSWLNGCVTLDGKQFIKTGAELGADWKLPRPPYLLETSLPGVFAVGDIRAGSVKRVASAVGEGSIAVSFVHQTLHE